MPTYLSVTNTWSSVSGDVDPDELQTNFDDIEDFHEGHFIEAAHFEDGSIPISKVADDAIDTDKPQANVIQAEKIDS
jgi:hypothetical protein